jgi:hypothetical protein
VGLTHVDLRCTPLYRTQTLAHLSTLRKNKEVAKRDYRSVATVKESTIIAREAPAVHHKELAAHLNTNPTLA